MINEDQREILADIFENTETLEAISVKLDPVTRSITVTYWDLDDEWFRELAEASADSS